jgi:hypothetical protein
MPILLLLSLDRFVFANQCHSLSGIVDTPSECQFRFRFFFHLYRKRYSIAD